MLPDVDLLILNGEALQGLGNDGGIGLNTGRNANTNDNNPLKMFDALNLGGNLAPKGFTIIHHSFPHQQEQYYLIHLLKIQQLLLQP
mgnify:CR=1 FL=1